ncbi:MAG: hypothetical protein ACKPJD_05950 [Planctomycetaceae bacterium]|jgi:hypothetical protein
MFFWLRELAGWGLLGASLVVLRNALGMAMNTRDPRIVEAAVVTVAALGLMRAGTLLIRISVAARLSRAEADNEKRT